MNPRTRRAMLSQGYPAGGVRRGQGEPGGYGVMGALRRLVGLVLLSVAMGSGGLGAAWPRPAWAAEPPRPPREQERIAALLDAVGPSGARFIREGKEYSGADGRKHLERKLRYAGDRVKTAEDFIEGIASRSSSTGRPYRVRLPGGEEMETGVWLRQKLDEIDAHR